MTRRPSIAIGLALVLLAACGDGPSDVPGRPRSAIPRVYTTFYPTAYFAERIGGDKVQVTCPLPDDADPIFWRPSAEVIARFQDDADLIVVNGAEFEKWIDTVSLPRARMVDTARGFREQWLRFATGVTHTHGDGEGHTHEGVDGHTWLDPLLALKQAQRIKDALSLGWPEHAASFQSGFDALAADLRRLDAAFAALGALPEGHWLYAAHPAYAYVARRYGWRMADAAQDGEPSESGLAELSTQLEAQPGRHLLWERAPAPQTIDVLRGAVSLESVVFSPCETERDARDAGGDYLAAMRANVERLRPAFGP